MAHRAVAGVVEDDGEHGEAVGLGHVVAGDRVGEQVRAVAHRGHDEPLGIGELHAERAGEAPAEPARVRLLAPRAVLGQAERLERAAQLGEDGRSAARGSPRRRSATPTPCVIGVPLPRAAAARASLAAGRVVVVDDGHAGAPAVAASGTEVAPSPRSSASEAGADLARDRQVGPEVPHREPAVQRVRAELHDRAAGRRLVDVRHPRGEAVDDEDHVGARRSTGPDPDRRTSDGRLEIAVATAHHWHTGIDHCSAMRASASKPAGEPAPRWATINGRSAPASSSADRLRAARVTATTVAAASGSAPPSSSAGQGSHSTSRGRLR